MQNALMSKFIQKNKRSDLPAFRPGDTIRVHVKIKEGDKERLQAFEGTVIARNNTGLGESITVRKVSFGQGVERIFPVHAKVVDHIDVVRKRRVANSAVNRHSSVSCARAAFMPWRVSMKWGADRCSDRFLRRR
jgi:large subunit ribosomal protein L19